MMSLRQIWQSGLLIGILIFSAPIYAQHCNNPFTTKFQCVDTDNNIIGTVGPFPEYLTRHYQIKNVTGVCMPDFPGNAIQICELLSATCNNKYHDFCKGTCTAGDSEGSISCGTVCFYHNCKMHPSGQIYLIR